MTPASPPIAHERFLFGTVFEATGEVTNPAPRPKRNYSAGEVEAIRQAAAADGEAMALASIANHQAQALAAIATACREALPSWPPSPTNIASAPPSWRWPAP